MLCPICFDAEDICFPETDDADLWLIDLLQKEGVPATFFMTGDKFDVLLRRNRKDVLQALSKMEIAFHSTHHSKHPTVFEFSQGKDHLQAVEDLEAREFPAIRRMEEYFNRPIRVFGQTGCSYTPAMVEALSRHHMAYAYMPNVMGPESGIFWWKDCLVFPRAVELPGFEPALNEDETITRLLEDFDRKVSEVKARGLETVYFFAGHPIRMISKMFPDQSFGGLGVNGSLSDFSGFLYTREEIQQRLKNYRRIFRHLKSHHDLTLTTFAEIMEKVPNPSVAISPADLDHWCRKYTATPFHLTATPALTAAEAVHALGRIFLNPGQRDHLNRVSPYGPLTMPKESAANYRVRRTELTKALPAFLQVTEQTERLPAEVQVDHAKMGLGHFARALANFHQNPELEETTVFSEFPFLSTGPYAAGQVAEALYGWPIHDMNLDPSQAIRQTLLASWCMRPVKSNME